MKCNGNQRNVMKNNEIKMIPCVKFTDELCRLLSAPYRTLFWKVPSSSQWEENLRGGIVETPRPPRPLPRLGRVAQPRVWAGFPDLVF